MRKRLSIQEKFDLIMECRNSSLSDYQWCKEHNLSSSTFYSYIKQVRRHNCEIPEPAELTTYPSSSKQDVVRLKVLDEPQPAYVSQNTSVINVPVMEISLRGISIKVTNDVNPLLLSSVVSALGDKLC